jgi:hypothetical protein
MRVYHLGVTILICLVRKPGKEPDMAKKSSGSKTSQGTRAEEETLLRSLRAHKQVVESDSADVMLKPGETHVYVKLPGKSAGKLVEKRKSFFKR